MKNAEELIDLFRKYGGIFENMKLNYRDDSGFYCQTLNSNKDSVVSCPRQLLVDTEDVDINENGLFISNPEKYGKNIEFLDKYFKFHFNKTSIDVYLDKKRQIDSLTSKEVALVSKVFPPYLYKLDKYEGLEYVKHKIFISHCIKYSETNTALMPFVTFLNYANNGIPYDVNKDAISVSGKFSDEVFARYNLDDTLMIAGVYEIIIDTINIYSLPVSYVFTNGKRIIIGRDLAKSANANDGTTIPLIEIDNDVIKISWFPMFSADVPSYPARISSLIAREANVPAEIILHIIFWLNLNALVPAAFQLRESKNPYAQFVAAAAQKQIELISGINE